MTEKTIDLAQFYDYIADDSPTGITEVSDSKLREIVRRAMEAEAELAQPPQPTDFTFDDLTMPITVTFKSLEEGLGHANQATGEIVIRKDLDPLGYVCILAHEMMHLAEGSLLAYKELVQPINHGFIHAASCGIAIALGRSGYIKGITEEHVTRFLDIAKVQDPGVRPQEEDEPADEILLMLCREFVTREEAFVQALTAALEGEVETLDHEALATFRTITKALKEHIDFEPSPDDNESEVLSNFAVLYVKTYGQPEAST